VKKLLLIPVLVLSAMVFSIAFNVGIGFNLDMSSGSLETPVFAELSVGTPLIRGVVQSYIFSFKWSASWVRGHRISTSPSIGRHAGRLQQLLRTAATVLVAEPSFPDNRRLQKASRHTSLFKDRLWLLYRQIHAGWGVRRLLDTRTIQRGSLRQAISGAQLQLFYRRSTGVAHRRRVLSTPFEKLPKNREESACVSPRALFSRFKKNLPPSISFQRRPYRAYIEDYTACLVQRRLVCSPKTRQSK